MKRGVYMNFPFKKKECCSCKKHDKNDDVSCVVIDRSYLDAVFAALYKSRVGIKDVRFCDPATVVFWEDGSKTVVKCMDGDTFNPEHGIAMATLKHIFGDGYVNYKKDVQRFIEAGNKREKKKKENGVMIEHCGYTIEQTGYDK